MWTRLAAGSCHPRQDLPNGRTEAAGRAVGWVLAPTRENRGRASDIKGGQAAHATLRGARGCEQPPYPGRRNSDR